MDTKDEKPKNPNDVTKQLPVSSRVSARKPLVKIVTDAHKTGTLDQQRGIDGAKDIPPHLCATAILKACKKTRLTIPRVWRSEIPRLILFFVSLFLAIYISRAVPITVITGEVFRVFGYQVLLKLPLVWLIPMFLLCEAAFRIYNVRYQIDREGVVTRVGIISINQSIRRIRYEDIRAIEPEQSLIERVLRVGKLYIGTGATGVVDLEFTGISDPLKVRDIILAERERRIRGARRRTVASNSQNEKKVVNTGG